MCSKHADEMPNSVDPYQPASFGAARSGSALFSQIYLSQHLKFLE